MSPAPAAADSCEQPQLERLGASYLAQQLDAEQATDVANDYASQAAHTLR